MTDNTATQQRPGTRRTSQPASAAPALTLPTEKTNPTLTFDNAKTLLYSEQGVGKTTFLTDLDAFILATEPGTGGLSTYTRAVRTWAEFRGYGELIASGDHQFKVVGVDTVDELFRMCQDYVMGQLGAKHPSDLEYGKGWAAVADEFRLRVGKLCSLGYGVVFTSHAKDVEIKQRVGSITKTVPSIRGQASEFLLGFVDYILYAAVEDSGDGEVHVVHTAKSEYHAAKSRIALDAKLVREAMTNLTDNADQAKETKS
jgi:hypothetical protein